MLGLSHHRVLTVAGVAAIGAAFVAGSVALWSEAVAVAQHDAAISVPSAAVLPAAPDDFEFDVGRVYSGQDLRHDFPVTNSSAASLFVAKPEDVVKNCGCSDVAPAALRLDAGDATHVTVAMRTAGKNGPFSYGGHIRWSAADGTVRTTTFTLRGHAILPLAADPDAIDFTPDDVRSGVTKEFAVTSPLPLDPASVSFDAAGDGIAIGSRQDGGRWLCRVRYTPAPGLESVVGVIKVTARVAKTATALADTEVKLLVPVRARQEVEFSVLPKTASVTFGDDGRGQVRLLLKGTALARGAAIVTSVSCEGYAVEWTLGKPSATHSAVLGVTLVPREGTNLKLPELRIHVEGRAAVCIPTVALRPDK